MVKYPSQFPCFSGVFRFFKQDFIWWLNGHVALFFCVMAGSSHRIFTLYAHHYFWEYSLGLSLHCHTTCVTLHCPDNKQIWAVASVPSGIFLFWRYHCSLHCQQTENSMCRVLKVENVGLVGFCVLVNIATFWVHFNSSCCFHPSEHWNGGGIWEGLGHYWLKLL